MTTLIKIARHTKSRLARIVEVIRGDMRNVKTGLASHEERISSLERPVDASDLHSSEVQENSRKTAETARTEILTDSELKLDLEQEFGTTKWAKKVIRSILGRDRPNIS